MIIAASFDINNPELWINRGLSYGDGLFETMCFNGHGIPLLDFHLKRLNKGLKKLQLDIFDGKVIESFVETQLVNQQQMVIKLTVFRTNQKRTYQPLSSGIEWLLTAEKLSLEKSDQPLKIKCSERKIAHQPLLAGMKHLSRLEQVVMASELNDHNDVDDLLITDVNNDIIETTYQNIILVKENQLFTPQLNMAGVEGVALQWLKINHEVNCEQINVEDIGSYECMMTCNSIRGFSSVDSLLTIEKQCISFGTKHVIRDKITRQWDTLFNS